MNESLDPAAVFACARSLYDACMERKDRDPEFKLAETYPGRDAVMRMVMRVANTFEAWACRHVAFHETIEVWPYFLQEHFGDACVEILDASSLGSYDKDDCFLTALRLQLPLKVDGSLPLPVCIEAPNPLAGARFCRLRIQTMRRELESDGEIDSFTEEDDPFDEEYSAPFFSAYGVDKDGMLHYIADCDTYQAAHALLSSLLPGVDFPEELIGRIKRS